MRLSFRMSAFHKFAVVGVSKTTGCSGARVQSNCLAALGHAAAKYGSNQMTGSQATRLLSI